MFADGKGRIYEAKPDRTRRLIGFDLFGGSVDGADQEREGKEIKGEEESSRFPAQTSVKDFLCVNHSRKASSIISIRPPCTAPLYRIYGTTFVDTIFHSLKKYQIELTVIYIPIKDQLLAMLFSLSIILL